MVENSTEVTVHHSKNFVAIGITWIAVMVPASFWMLHSLDDLFPRILATAFILVSILILHQSIRILMNNFFMKISASGIESISYGMIPWSDISEANFNKESSTLNLLVYNREIYTQRLGTLSQLFQRALPLFYRSICASLGAPAVSSEKLNRLITIQLSNMDKEPSQINLPIQYWLEKYRGNNPEWNHMLAKQIECDALDANIEDTRKKLPIFFTTFGALGAIACIIGLIIIFVGIKNVLIAYNSSSWTETIGIIQKSELKEDHDSEGGTSYSPVISYTYSVNGKSFIGKEISPAKPSSPSSKSAHKEIAKYSLGSKHPVYYSPENSAVSFLEKGLHPYNFVILIAGTLFFSFGSLFGGIALSVFKNFKENGTRFVRMEGNSISFSDTRSLVIFCIGFVLLAAQFALIFWLCPSS